MFCMICLALVVVPGGRRTICTTDPVQHTGWFTLKNPNLFPCECLRRFFIQTVNICTRLLCALANTSPDVFCLFFSCFFVI